MAKIAKFDKYSSKLKKSISTDVYYHLDKSRNSSSSGFFYVIIPEEIAGLWEQSPHKRHFYNRGTSKKVLEGKSAEEVMTHYEAYLVMYEAAKTTVTQVIMYRLKFSSKNKTSDPAKKKSSFMDGVDHTPEAILEFDFAVCDKTDFNGKITYQPHDEKGQRRFSSGRDSFNKPVKKTGMGYGGWIELPYTIEAEAFFTQIYTGMENIMDKLMLFIGTDDDVVKAIEKNQKLLV